MVLSTRLKDEEMVGEEKGIKKGEEKNKREVAIDMLKDGVTLKLVERYSKLSEAEIRSIAQAHGLAVKE